MTLRPLTRLLMTIMACTVSGAVSGYVLIGPGAGEGLLLPLGLAFGGLSYLSLLRLLQFLSPGIIFGLAFSIGGILGIRIESRHVSIVHASVSVVVYTIASTAIWFATYWIVAIPYNSGLRNLIFPGTIAGLCGGVFLSLPAIVLPNVRAHNIRWTTIIGAVAGLLFFLNPAIEIDLSTSSSTLLPIVAWCISFAVWQGAVGLALAMGMRVSEAPGTAAKAIAPVPAEANRPAEAQIHGAEERTAISKKPKAGLARNVATIGLLAIVLSVAAFIGGITISNRKPMLTLTGHTDQVDRIAFSPDGTRLATASTDGTAKIWDAATGKELLSLHAGVVNGIVFNPDGKRLVTASWDKTAQVWDAATGKELLTLTSPDSILGLALSPDGNRLAAAGYEGTIEIWDANTGMTVLSFDSLQGQLRSIGFSPDGMRLATANFLRDTASVWDANTGKELLTLTGHTLPVEDVAFSPDGKLLATASQDGTAKIWDATTGKELLTLMDPNRKVGSVTGVAFSPDGKRLATADTTAKVWDVATGKELLTLNDGTSGIIAVAFSPDGKRLGTASSYKTANVWDVHP